MDEDISKKFIDSIEYEIRSIYKEFKFKKKIKMTRKDEIAFQNAEICHICDQKLDNDKVRDHCHLTGRYRGAAHDYRNKNYQIPKFFPVIFHNLTGYDSHISIKNLGVSEGLINCIPINEEKYISFTKDMLLADVFENFRDVCIENYKLDPAWYYTAPGLAWDACLKKTEVRLELLNDVDMLLMIEKRIRGGVSTITKRHAEVNNPYMKTYDSNSPNKYITYIDANNLYGLAMSQPLPTHGIEWLSEEELKNWRSHSCIPDVDLEYPKEPHDLHNNYPLAPERLKIGGIEKLIPNLYDKKCAS